ncbi:MAG: cell surface protein SprA [Reichenbachiella sp.]
MSKLQIHITSTILLFILFSGWNQVLYAQKVDSSAYTPSFLPTYTPQDRYGDPFSNTQSPSPLLLQDPSNLELELEIDSNMNYTITEKVGALYYRPRSTMTFEQFKDYQEAQMKKQYWQDRSAGADGESAVSGRRLIPKLYISPVFDRIFGGNYVDIQPNGFVTMDFGGKWQNVEDPNRPVEQRKNGGFNFDQQISMNLIGKVGEKLAVTANFDNNNSFDFQNNMKIEYTGYEEDIIKKIELGNVSMPVANSLMTGGQSLFGVKTQLQFGKLYVTALASRQQGSAQTKSFTNGSDGSEFQVRASEYDEYKHFFLGHFFRDNYEKWLEDIPRVRSGVQVTRLEVYVVKQENTTTGLRGIVAFTDLGETVRIANDEVTSKNPPGNIVDNKESNDLYDNIIDADEIRDISKVSDYLGVGGVSGLEMVDAVDFEARQNVKKLDPSEYKWNTQLGYISLRSRLRQGEILAVSYEYSYNGNVYRVGELSDAYQGYPDEDLIILKLLLPSKLPDPEAPIWDLGMKNIYNLGGSRISQEGFELRINYRDDINNYDAAYLNEGQNTNNTPLLEIMSLDQLNVNGDNQPDANFDFIDGITFDSDYGNVIFPVLEPFGVTLEEAFTSDEQKLKDKYVYSELYDRTKTLAEQVSSKNKFRLTGKYSSGAQGSFNLDGFNIAPNSVIVMAGNTQLRENEHYNVNYATGEVSFTSLGEAEIASGKTINITYETEDMFSFQSKWLTGTRLDYQFNENFNIGATVMHLKERPGGVTRYSMGSEPVNNTKYGFDVNFQEDSRIITKALDALPLISTKETSTVTFNGEFAQLIPGTSNEVNGESTAYIDDFENSATPYGLGGGSTAWTLGSTPAGFKMDGDLGEGFKRAKLAWYEVDVSVYNGNLITDKNAFTSSFSKPVYNQDIFQQQDAQVFNTPMRVFDMAYYPSERGPYNYNIDELSDRGFLENPFSNFGAITRRLPLDNNFETNNVEYIEFWLMDPFGEVVLDGFINEENEDDRGKLILHLGDVKLDVIPDNRLFYEHGLPGDGSTQNVEESPWGKAVISKPVTDYFSTDGGERSNQDVGFDGLKSSEENGFFPEYTAYIASLGAQGQRHLNDISSDDFKHYLDGEYDVTGAKLLERYKSFNGYEENSPAQVANNASATTIPNSEDVLGDGNIVNNESYFEYEIPINTNDLDVGSNYVVDKVEDSGGKNWYLMRIPVKKPSNTVGNASFEDVKLMRMHMTGWTTPVVLRMAKFQMVAFQKWRKHDLSLADPGFSEIPETSDADLEISVVNIEENGTSLDGNPPYMVPPGIDRDNDNTTRVARRLNEQSIKVCASNIEDGDARAIYKANNNFDMINYGKIKMFFHGESYNGEPVDTEDSLTVFLRFGLDRTDNYYEIELPLEITPHNQGSYTDREIWPESNEINMELDELYTLKSARNGDDFSVTSRYSRDSKSGKYKLHIVGNPKLSGITDVMIGVRNPKSDDGASKSVCIWANEMRVTDFDSEKGWAANAQMNLKLADFASINLSGRHTTVGFGGIQQTISERTREETTTYDVSANVNVDKLIPVETGIKIPMFVSTSKTTAKPRYDPLDDDVPLDASLDKFKTQKEKSDYEKKVISQVTNRSINFINVRKEKVRSDAKSHIYDIENFAFSYSYSERKLSNVNTESAKEKQYSGSVAWNYTMPNLTIEPFKNVNMSSPYLKLIKDINFNPLPNSFSFRGSMDRRFKKTQLRNVDLTTDGIDPNFEKFFNFNRSYNLRWSLFKGMSLNYNANVRAIIDEPEGDIDTQVKRDSIWNNIKRFGRTKTFDQSAGLTYRLPLDKLPITDWMSADYRYAVDYSWLGGNVDQVNDYGNVVSNSRNQDLTGKIDLVRLYNKSKYLSKINRPPPRSRTSRYDTVRSSGGTSAFKGVLRLIMSVRSVNVTYGVREATTLPGMVPSPHMFGMDSDFESPGWGFVMGSQDPGVRRDASDNGWLVLNREFSDQFVQSRTEDIGIRSTIEPFKDFRIQVDMKRTNTSQYTEIYRKDSLSADPTDFLSLTPNRTGSYSISFLPIQTAFSNPEEVFRQFEENRAIIQRRQNLRNTSGQEYAVNSQDVLLPALISAYRGISANNVKLIPFPTIPMPNWRMDYGGLSKLSGFKTIFSSINLTHAYSSTFNLSQYSSSARYSDVALLELTNDIIDYPLASEPGDDGNLVPVYIINQVDILERFSPLIGLNVRTKNMITAKIEYGRERNLRFDLSNTQLTELKSDNFSFDFGIAKDKMKIPFKIKGRTVTLDNQIEFRLSFTVRDTQTTQRIIEDVSTVTEGNISYQLRPTVSYVVNDKLNITMYYNWDKNLPKISSSYERTNTAFGIQVRFSLAQ